MANENISDVVREGRSLGGPAPGLVGVYGRLRIEVAGKPVGTLVIDGPRVALTPDTTGPADAIVVVRGRRIVPHATQGRAQPVRRFDARVGADEG